MKIKTQLSLTMGLSGIIFILAAVLLLVTNQQGARLHKLAAMADNIEQTTRELSYLSNAYLLHGEDLKRTQWESKISSLSAYLSKIKPDIPEQQALVEEIGLYLIRLKAVFDDVKSVLESRPRNRNPASHLAFLQVSWSRMEVQTQGIISDALRLSQKLHDQENRLKQRTIILVLILTGIFVAYFLFTYLLTNRRILKAMSDLQAGTKIVGSGDLDFVLSAKHEDEIGDLSQAFNRMTASLRETTASRTELEKEIVNRDKAEAELRRRSIELQHLTETQEERVKERTQELAELSFRLVSAQENERERISYELHDHVWQNLVAIRLEIENLFSDKGNKDWKDLQRRSNKIMDDMLETVGKIRSMQGDLWPYVLDDIGLVATLDWYSREFGKRHPGLAVKISDGITEAEIPAAAKIVIYRILQEALNNVAKHSQAGRVTIRLTTRDQGLEFSIEDDGVGFDPEETIARRSPWGGLGLLSIKARTELSGGVFEVESAKGKGTTIQARWPI